jgi:hypothetical protein
MINLIQVVTIMLFKALKTLSIGWLLLSSQFTSAREFCKKTGENYGDYTCEELIAPVPPLVSPCQENFELIAGAITGSTTLWMLAELHAKRSQTIKCAEELTANSPVHRIYVEDYQAGKEIPCSKADLIEKPGRTCIGWDKETDAQKAAKLLLPDGTEFILADLESYYESGEYPAEYLDIILKRLANNHSPENIDLDIPAAKILRLRNSGTSYPEIFAQKEKYKIPELSNAQAKELKFLNRKRNAFLIDTLNGKSTHEFGVVLSGRAHLKKKIEAGVEDTGSAEYVRRELNQGKHQNTYAILAMRN